ncbi:MAG: 16S rRNA (guanine(966)-N(2))-methyltransferase RsmD [Gammaproteobacteria bacterium]|nr:16S rRNA (guanine(966)-N(2))-methyltransferase RsmD [Gammaproteobacteria bacterium]NNF62353.1 16S rRNA (guanine(966)-N(2))-methyltransferase RsmD [Gammaproteobacteria bacterium]NNM21222.1 16S rRNA (guanine(966)-N(2))-methyltransferase RsmD [Gammaproteobacteria bacterium]
MSTARHKRRGASGSFRIIGGQWRGRRLRFPDTGELRPTPDRVRETVFNWLSPIIDGASCLDLYSGSGALGLEALSRGAAACTFVERNDDALETVRTHLELLQAQGGHCVRADALAWLKRCEQEFDVIFIDPPYEEDPWSQLLYRIGSARLLRPGGRLYLETAAGCGPPALPDGLELLRSKRAGRVGYHLVSISQETP